MHLKYECSTANSDVTFYARSMFNSIGVGGGANNIQRLFMNCRLKRLEFRGISSAVNKITTLRLRWLGANDSQREITASGNTEQGFALTTSPSQKSLSGFWKANLTTDALFSVATDSDFGECQMDVFYDAVLYDNAGGSLGSGLLAAGTIGVIYTSAFDSTTDGTTWQQSPVWIPVGRTTIA